MDQKYLIALEVGSSKIRGALGVVDHQGILTVKAIEEERLVDSVRHGCVCNVGEVAASVSSILQRLENREGGRHITGVYVALGGRSMLSSPCRVERRMSADTVINSDHLRQIYEEARSTALNERDVIEAVPAEFFIDNTKIAKPNGAIGREIEALYNLVSCRTKLRRNLNHTLEKSLNLDVKGYVVRQLAEAALVIQQQERQLGCVLVDFGAETTTVSIYKEGYLCYLATLPMGSRNITRDITSLSYLEETAERLKIAGGDASTSPDSVSTMPGDGTDYTRINELVSARTGEIIANIEEQIKLAGMTSRNLPAGFIVVGGGAKLRGFNKRLASMTHMEVRTGLPSSHVRIIDNRIQPGDAIDVISILAAVAANKNASDCFEPLRQVENADTDISPRVDTIDTIGSNSRHADKHQHIVAAGNDDDDDDILIDDDNRANETHRRRTWLNFDRLKQRITKIMSENEEDTLDDEMTDDDTRKNKK